MLWIALGFMEFKPDLSVSSDPTKLAGYHRNPIDVLCLYVFLLFINLLEFLRTKLATQFVEVYVSAVDVSAMIGPFLWGQKS